VRSADRSGYAIEVELWSMPVKGMGLLMAEIPSPLAIGIVELDDGRNVHGFLCESHAVAGAREISEFGGWRGFLTTQAE
jgi:allophanate hydrolase